MFKTKLLIVALGAVLGAGLTVVTFRMIRGAPRSVLDYGAKGDGTDEHVAIQNALNVGAGVVWMPASAQCYNVGTTTITIPSRTSLVGAGMGGPSSGPACITYTGTGCAVLLDSVVASGLRELDVQVNSASATAAGVCVKATTGVSEFNEISGVTIRQTNATRRVAGQVGLLLQDNGANGIFWNTVRRIRLAYWDTAVKLIGNAGNGTNANHFDDVMTWGHVTGLTTSTTFVVDNRFFGFHCSRSDGTYAGSQTCVALVAAGFNKFYDMTSDQGAPSVCMTIDATSGGNVVETDCESGGAVTDSNATGFPTRLYEQIAGATPSRMTLGRLVVKNEFTMGATPSLSGDIRLTNNQNISWRNGANSADLPLVLSDASDRMKIGTSAAFLRLNNNIIEHGTGTVANSGSERYVHNWSNLGRNNANNANRTIWSWGVTADQLDIGDANATVNIAAPWTPVLQANLGTPGNGIMRYCSDCTIANPCAGAGTGALAKRLNGVWVCN